MDDDNCNHNLVIRRDKSIPQRIAGRYYAVFWKQLEKLIPTEPTLEGYKPKVASGTLYLSKGTNDWEIVKFKKEGTKYVHILSEKTMNKFKLDATKLNAMVATAAEQAASEAD